MGYVEIFNFIKESQTLIVGVFGFSGVIVTLLINAKVGRDQRWWECKVDAYEKVIIALHKSKIFSEAYLEENYRNRDLPEEKYQELGLSVKIRKDEIDKAINTGAFLLSQKAVSRLQEYRRDAEKATHTEHWVEYLENDFRATDSCLKGLIEAAKIDLKQT